MTTAVAIKILNNKLLSIMSNKYCILCVKNYLLKTIEDVAVVIAKQEVWKVERVKSFLVKHNWIFRGGILQ